MTWKSTNQSSVALSSTEAEYMGQTMAATQAILARGLLEELQIEGTIPERCNSNFTRNNQTAIQTRRNPYFPKTIENIFRSNITTPGTSSSKKKFRLQYMSNKQNDRGRIDKTAGTGRF